MGNSITPEKTYLRNDAGKIFDYTWYMKLSQFKSSEERRKFLENTLHIDLNSIGTALTDEDGIHCENLIGATTLPLGVAGPLKIKGDREEKECFVPLATTEGALVASVSRGCKATDQAGGISVFVYRAGTSRGPVFDVKNLTGYRKLSDWINAHEDLLKKTAEQSSHHLKLREIKIQGTANYLFVRFNYDTQDAMGMNMVTIATTKIVELITKETGVACLSVAGNYDIDKKPAWLNFIENRGFCVRAEAIVSQEIVREVLKTTPSKIFDVWLAKCMIGSAMSGSMGFNSHYANIIAAIYAATGQDLAHVVEGSMGVTTAKVLENNDLYFSVYIPALMLGTVGGGTTLKIKQEALQIMGVKKSEELAEVVAGAVLAGELSLVASLAEGSLAKVHQKLGR